MKTIWKYPLERDTRIEMPEGARVVRFDVDPSGQVCVWAIVDPEIPVEPQALFIVGTGHPIPEGGEYVDSCQQGPFVWHLFEWPPLTDAEAGEVLAASFPNG